MLINKKSLHYEACLHNEDFFIFYNDVILTENLKKDIISTTINIGRDFYGENRRFYKTLY